MAFMDKFYLLPFVFLLFLERFFLLATLDTSSIGVFSIFAGIFLLSFLVRECWQDAILPYISQVSSGLETSTKNSRNGMLGVWRDSLLHLYIGNLFSSGIVRIFPVFFRLPLDVSAFYPPQCSTVLLFHQTLHVTSKKIWKLPVFVGKYQPVSRWSPFVYHGKSGSLLDGFHFCDPGYESASVISSREKIPLYSSDPSGIFRKITVCAILYLVSFGRLTFFPVHVFDPGFPGSIPGVQLFKLHSGISCKAMFLHKTVGSVDVLDKNGFCRTATKVHIFSLLASAILVGCSSACAQLLSGSTHTMSIVFLSTLNWYLFFMQQPYMLL